MCSFFKLDILIMWNNLLPSVLMPTREHKTTQGYFYLLCKLGRFDLYKRCTHSLQVTALIVKSDTTRTCKISHFVSTLSNQLAGVEMMTWQLLTSVSTHLWGTCVCPCRCRRTWPLQRGRSWCWPAPRRSACRAERQQTPSYSDPNVGLDSARSCYPRSPRGSPGPGAETSSYIKVKVMVIKGISSRVLVHQAEKHPLQSSVPQNRSVCRGSRDPRFLSLGGSSCLVWLVSTHILASHPAARHLEVVLSVVLGVKGVLGAGMEQRTHGFVTFKHQIDVPCKTNAALLDSFSTTKPSADSQRCCTHTRSWSSSSRAVVLRMQVKKTTSQQLHWSLKNI